MRPRPRRCRRSTTSSLKAPRPGSETSQPATTNISHEHRVRRHRRPRPWNITYIRRFVTLIGPISSIFDFITFGVLYFILKATENNQALFHTGWFLESITTQTLVIYMIRTHKFPFIESKPSKFLVFMSALILLVAFALPFSGLAASLGLVQPPSIFYLYLVLIVLTYLLLVHFVKVWFVKKYGFE